MTGLWINMWGFPVVAVDNTGLSTYRQTTRLQDVLFARRLVTCPTRAIYGPNRVNPQSTALITVIRFIYRFAQITTINAHIKKDEPAGWSI